MVLREDDEPCYLQMILDPGCDQVKRNTSPQFVHIHIELTEVE
jgi:hypothetical protein